MNGKVWLIIILTLFLWADLSAEESPVAQGTFMIDGRIRLSSTWGDDFSVDKTQNIVFTPSVMYFPISGFAIGGRFNIQHYDVYGFDMKQSFLGLGAGYYAKIGEKNNYLYSELSFGLIGLDQDGYSDGSGQEYGIGFGFLNFIGRNLAVKGGLEYIIQKIDRGPYRTDYFPLFKAGEIQDSDDKLEGRITQIVFGLSYFVH